MPLIWNNQLQAFEDSKVPMTYNHAIEAWEDTGGLEYNHELEAWEKVWPTTPMIELPLTDSESFAKLIRSLDSTGTMTWTTSGVTPSIPQNGGSATYYYVLPERATFDGDFEFAANIYLEPSESKLGAVSVQLNGDGGGVSIGVSDAWTGNALRTYVSGVNGTEIYRDYASSVVRNGAFAIKRVGNLISFYSGSTVLKSISYDAPVIFDRIQITAKRDSFYTLNTIYVKDIYAGPLRV